METLAPLLKEEGFKVKTASAKKSKLLRLLDMLWLVYRNRKTTDYVLIDTYSTLNFWYAYATGLLCQWLQLKYICILHGGELPSRIQNSFKAAKRLFNHASLNVAPSLYMKTIFQQAGFLRVQYIPNSITLKNYKYKQRPDLRPKLLWVRAFAGIYNPLQALKVLELLLPNYPDAELCMVGPRKDTSYEECLRYARSKDLPVKFSGSLSKKEWIDLAQNYDIFLNTTTVDNTPVSVIEAMALGLPVISTNVGGLPFLISADIDGILVPPKNDQRMAQAVEKCLQESARSVQRTLAAREKIEAFDWEKVKIKWRQTLSTETALF